MQPDASGNAGVMREASGARGSPGPGSLSRRRWLRLNVAAVATAALPPPLATAAASRGPRACIFLFMEGGPSHLDTLDPKPALARYDGRLVARSAVLVPRVYRASTFRFARAGRTEIVWNAEFEHLARVAHRICVYRGVRPASANHTLARDELLSLPDRETLLPARSVGDGGRAAGWLVLPDCPPSKDGTPVLDAGPDRGTCDEDWSDALRIQREPAWLQARYGVGATDAKLDSMARRCLAARRLLARGARLVQVTLRGWDAHENLESRYRRLIHVMDQPVAALLEDMAAAGLLQETLVVWAGEFGRSAESAVTSGAWGREHNGQAMAIWMAGAGVPGGVVSGATDELGTLPATSSITVAGLRRAILDLLVAGHDTAIA